MRQKDNRDDLYHETHCRFPDYLKELQEYTDNVLEQLEKREKEVETLIDEKKELEEAHSNTVNELESRIAELEAKVEHYESLPELRGYIVGMKVGIV